MHSRLLDIHAAGALKSDTMGSAGAYTSTEDTPNTWGVNRQLVCTACYSASRRKHTQQAFVAWS